MTLQEIRDLPHGIYPCCHKRSLKEGVLTKKSGHKGQTVVDIKDNSGGVMLLNYASEDKEYLNFSTEILGINLKGRFPPEDLTLFIEKSIPLNP